MGLPKLSNDKPIYELTVPSTNQTVKYRPFLVKEQKSMLVAFESKDTKQILLDSDRTITSKFNTVLSSFNKEIMSVTIRYCYYKIK